MGQAPRFMALDAHTSLTRIASKVSSYPGRRQALWPVPQTRPRGWAHLLRERVSTDRRVRKKAGGPGTRRRAWHRQPFPADLHLHGVGRRAQVGAPDEHPVAEPQPRDDGPSSRGTAKLIGSPCSRYSDRRATPPRPGAAWRSRGPAPQRGTREAGIVAAQERMPDELLIGPGAHRLDVGRQPALAHRWWCDGKSSRGGRLPACWSRRSTPL